MFRGVSRRYVGIGLVVATVVTVVALSPSFGRAHPTANYRPPLAPAALDNGCFPLPDGVRLDFPYQVRSDGDVETGRVSRRHLLLQFDEIDVDDAVAEVAASFGRAGFDVVSSEPVLRFRKPGVGRVRAVVQPLPDVTPDSLVRGTVALDLPTIEVQSDDPECSNPYSTKRFGNLQGQS